jgi:BioD-like phosphotransacetylase family protein
MPAVQVIAAAPLAGKTTVAVGLARGLKEAGVANLRLARVGSDERAARDAEAFAELTLAATTGSPVAAGRVAAGRDVMTVAETDGGAPVAALPAIVVVRAALTAADRDLARSLGDRLIGTIATLVPAAETEALARDLTNSDMRPLALLPEDATLAAPAIAEVRAALDATVLHDGDNERQSVENILVAPIYTDGARSHFHRFASKLVLTPYQKTDLQLAAIEAGAACLVVTGGHQPSPYVLDRVRDEETTVLLSARTTVPTVAALAAVWTRSPFRGAAKAEAVWDLLRSRIDFAGLQRKIQG